MGNTCPPVMKRGNCKSTSRKITELNHVFSCIFQHAVFDYRRVSQYNVGNYMTQGGITYP